MRLESINIGRTETIVFDGKSMQTGICKEPVKGPVQVTVDGLPDDAILADDGTEFVAPIESFTISVPRVLH